MTQRVVIDATDSRFSAVCAECGTAFAGYLDEDLPEGVFLCRFGHAIAIERRADEPPQATAASAA